MYKKYAKAYEVLKAGVYDYDGPEPVKHIYERFISEKSWEIERIGRFNALVSWLEGLALNIPYSYYDIEQTFGINQKQAQRYFPFMAMRLQELFKSERLI